MAYKLTPAHAAAIAEADAILRAAGIATYTELMQGTACLLTGLREAKPTQIDKGKTRLAAAMETLRNDSADPRPVLEPRSHKAAERQATAAEFLGLKAFPGRDGGRA